MKKLVEWCFEFCVAPARSGEPPVTDEDGEMLMDASIDWAVSLDYGIGGGFETGGEVPGSLAFRFGLCATLDDQLISDEEAQQLVDHLKEIARGSGWVLTGGFREYTAEDEALFAARFKTEDDDDSDEDEDESD